MKKVFFRRAQKRALALRLFVVLAVIATSLTFSASASAGTLTTPTWTVMDPRTNIDGNRYDWSFTTATAGVIDRVTLATPQGTTGSSRYVALNGTTNNFVSTPDSALNSASTFVDMRARVEFKTWPPTPNNVSLFEKRDATNASYSCRVTVSAAMDCGFGGDADNRSSAVALNVQAGVPVWLRTTIGLNSGIATFTMYQSIDGNSWTQIHSSTQGTSSTGFYDGVSDLIVGNRVVGVGQPFDGKIIYADLRTSATGTTTSASACSVIGVVNCIDPNNAGVGNTTWTSASPTAETWTLNRSGTNRPADIASDLSVLNRTGIGSGVAQLREIDSVASFKVANPVSVPAGTQIKLGIAGMTSSNVAGSYQSSIQTRDSASAVIDSSAATTAVTFSGPTYDTLGGSSPFYGTATPALTTAIAPTAIALSGNTVYVTDRAAASVYSLDQTAGTFTTFAGSGTTGSGSNGQPATGTVFWQPEGVATDGAGKVFVSDTAQSDIRKIEGGTATMYAGTLAVNGFNGDGVATAKQINYPAGSVVDGSGTLYFADRSNHRIRKVDTSGNMVTIAGNGTAGTAGDGGLATSANLNTPTDVAVDAAGNVYIADRGNHRVRKVTLATGIISTVAGTGSPSFNGASGVATTINLSTPSGVAIDVAGNLYIAERDGSRIRKVDTSGNLITIAGTGVRGTSGDGGQATAATLLYPRSLRVDGAGNVYFVEDWKVRKIDTAGVITTILGTGTSSSWTGDGGPIEKARIWFPQQISSTSGGDSYIAEALNNVIRKVDRFGNVSTVAGNGYDPGGFSGDGGPATSAILNNPNGVAAKPDGTIYIADQSNSRIRKVSAGLITTFASIGTPTRLSLDPAGNLYVSTPCAIWKFDPAGTGTVIAGTGSCGFSGDGGLATAATVNQPKDLVFDSAGNGYFADTTNNRVRRIDTVGVITTVAGGGASSANNVLATTASLGSTRGVFVDGTDAIYVQNFGSLRKFRVGGLINTVSSQAGGGSTTFVNGHAYTSDYNAQVIRRISNVAPLAPLVNNDAMTVPLNTQRQWPILSNDWSRSNQMDPNSVAIKTQSTNGTVTLSNPSTEGSTLQAIYTPNTGFSGTDSFTYQACDTTMVQCGTATVTVNVSANNAVTTVAGGPTEGYGANIAVATGNLARFGRYLFYSDSLNQVIRRQDLFTGQSVVIAGSGVAGYSGDGGPATAGSIKATKRMAFTPDGVLYFVDDGNGAIRYVTPAGTIATLSALAGTGGLAIKSDGTLLAQNGAAVKAWNGSTWVPFAGTGVTGSAGNGGLAVDATFKTPQSIYAAANGDVYIGDYDGCTVRVVSNGVVNAFAGSGSCFVSGDGGPATSGGIYRVESLTVMTNGTMIIGDSGGNRTRKVIGGVISTANSLGRASDLVAGANGGAYGTLSNLVRTMGTSYTWTQTIVNVNQESSYAGDGQIGVRTQLGLNTGTNGLAVGPDGTLYVQDIYRIRAFDSSAARVSSTFAGDGSTYPGGLGGPSSQMIFSPAGNLVFEINNCLIFERKPDTSLEILAGTGTCGYSGDNGLATAARINVNVGLAYAPDGALLIADKLNNRIRRVDPATKIITTIAGTGTASFSGDGGLAVNATFSNPQSLVVMPGGGIAVSDVTNNRVRIIDDKGYVTTIVSGLSGARAITADAMGNLFIAEQTGHRLRKYDASTGTTTVIAGSGTAGYNENTTAAAALVSNPSGLAVSGTDLYVADAGNSRVRRFAGVASAATNNLGAVSWTNVPTAIGHTDTLTRLSVTPTSNVTASKLTFQMPTSFAAASAATVETYGLSGTLTPSVSGTTLTLTFPSQTLNAGVPIAVSIKNVTTIGAAGSYVVTANLFDSAGTTAVGWSRSNVGNLQASGLPNPTDPGFGSMWKRNMATTASVPATIAVSPNQTSDATSAFTVTGTGSINSRSAQLSATAATTGTYGFTPVTPNSSTSVASASFPVNRWGLQVATSTGANAGAAGTGQYSGLATTATPVATATAATNVLTVTSRAKVDYLQPAGTYRSALTWRLTGGV